MDDKGTQIFFVERGRCDANFAGVLAPDREKIGSCIGNVEGIPYIAEAHLSLSEGRGRGMWKGGNVEREGCGEGGCYCASGE